MDHKLLFFNQEIVVETVIASLLVVFPREAFDRVDIVPEGLHLKVSNVPIDAVQTVSAAVTRRSFIIRESDIAHFL